MADEFSLALGLGGPAAALLKEVEVEDPLPRDVEGRSSAVNDLLLSPPTATLQQHPAAVQKKKKTKTKKKEEVLEPTTNFDSAEFSLRASYGVLPTPLASLSFSSSCPFLGESTEADRQKMEDSSNASTKKKKKEKTKQESAASCNKEKEAVEDDDDEERSNTDHNKEKEVEKEEEDTSSEDGDEDESEDEDVKAKKKAKAQKREKKEKKEKKERKSSVSVEADEKEKQVREIEDRMKRELARLEEQRERVQLELERLKSGAGAPRSSDATTAKAKDESEDRKERKAREKKEKTKKKAEKGQRAESQQVSTRAVETGAASAEDQTERALSVLEDAQRVRIQTQDVVSASATVRTNAKKQKKKDKKKKEAQAKESISDGESHEGADSGGHNDKPLDAVKREEKEEEDGKSDDSDSDSDSDDEHERAAKKEAKKSKKEEKEKEKKRRKEEKEREKTKRKEEKRKRRGERKARKAERKLLRKKPGGSGLMSSIDSNASIGSNDQAQRKIESALWSEFVPFILRESHSGLFASLSTRRPDGRRRKPRRDADGDDDDDESSADSDSESDTSSLSTSSSAVSDADVLSGARSSRCGSEAPNAVPVELEQLMLGVHKFLTAVVCNAGFTGSDVFEATTGRLVGLSGLFAHPLGRNAFAVALKKLARQNTSFLLTEEGFQCILCLIEQVINAFDFKRYETDLSVARVIMNIASTFHRTLDGSTQFVQQFITAYTVWRDLMFWEKFFWDELAVAQRKGYQHLDADDDQKKASDASETQAGEAPTDAATESEEFVPFNPTLIFVLLHSTAYNMLNWDVDVRSVRKFVTRMCKKTCLSHDQRQSIMEIVDSFARSLLAPAEGTFDTQRDTSSGSSEDVSRKLGVRKKSTVGGDSQSVEKKAEASWSKEVLAHVIEELSRLTEEQQKLMTRKAEEREEEEKRQEKERKKKAAADSKKGKGGKVEAGRKHLEKARLIESDCQIDTFQEVQLVQRSRVIEELVNTEKSYLANLMGTVQHFLEPFRRAKVISEGEINLLFSNIEIIVGLSQTFLTRLEERLASWKADNRAPGEQFLSDIFALVFPFMKIYATYCGNFEDVNSYLHRNKNNEKLTRFIRQCELQTNHKLDLPSLLIMPVQRIPRYRLLLQELIKCTAPHHADYRKLCSALEMIKNIADFVNEQTKGSRLHTMQKNFGPKADSIVEPWRVWIKDGHLRALAIVEGAKVQIIPMYVILFNDLLVYAKSPKEYLGKVHLQEAWVKDEQDAGEMQNILQFYSPSAAFLFAANSDEEKYEWIKALATNIDRQLQVDECREKRRSVLAEITKRKKSKSKNKNKKQNKDSQEAGVADPLVASAESSEDKKQKKSKKKSKPINEDLLSAFLQFHPNVIPNTAHELLTTTQRIEKTFRTLSRHFSFRNVKEVPREGEKVKNDLDLATPPTLAFSERQLPTRASRQIPPIPPPKTPATGAPLTAPSRGRAASAASAPSPTSSSSSPWPSSRADVPPPQSPRKGGGSGVESSASLKKSSGFWGGLWSNSSNQQVTTTAATGSSKGSKNSTPTPTSSNSGSGSSSDIFRL